MSTPDLRAVVFDLFGTLVPNLHPPKLTESMTALADVFSVAADDFRREWTRNFVSRMDGTIPDGDNQFVPILEALGVSVTRSQLERATEIRREFMLEALSPKPDAVECLDSLRAQGFKLALATDCSSETPLLLDSTPLGSYFEVRACSAHLGVRKPDPKMYTHVLGELDLSGEECLYVGDGNSEELPGAKAHGMTTVWVDNGDTQHWHERFVPDGDHTVRQLIDVLDLLGR